MTRPRRRTGILAAAVGALVAGTLLLAPADAAAAAGVQGGDAVYSGQYRCTLAFNVRDANGAYYFIASGHCGASVGSVWYSNSTHTTALGTTFAVSSLGGGIVIVKYPAGVVPPGSVDLHNGSSQDITTAVDPYVGEAAKRSGSTTGVHSGSVTGVNVTVNYPEGTVTGLIRTNICAEGGDTGGPLFDGTKALGVLVSASGNCSSGGTTFYEPITKILAAYGLSVY
ncbi:S1 family peptidase [Jatrophihabitans sp.]|uniref:S1 family peptidase n=1 Tax=Jatrophihabitans sp. TaxID=1932789 RepID=UPI002B6AD153|nr:S1 family peptidase [Jatrophihabitans sp.]